jgi:hypothetical protein
MHVLISGGGFTGNPHEAEDEAEASPMNVGKPL